MATIAAADAQQVMVKALPSLLSQLPTEWRGTTFKNNNLVGRCKFSERLLSAVYTLGADISQSDLEAIGNAEDYLRVASNIATTLEVVLALQSGLDVSRVFTFGSKTMPLVAILLTQPPGKPVHLYVGDKPSPLTNETIDTLSKVGGKLVVHAQAPCNGATEGDGQVRVALASAVPDVQSWQQVDAVIAPNVLYIINNDRIPGDEVMVIRKRTATPVTTPIAEAMLQGLASLPVTANKDEASPEEVAAFYAHLQEMQGTRIDVENNPVTFTAGLPTIASLWLALVAGGGADICMASTAYGGSSQLTDLLSSRTETLRKHTFDIQGTAGMSAAISGLLDKLSAEPSALMPTTVLFCEIPTNPDMKVPEMGDIAAMLASYETRTKKRVVLLVDATFAPCSKVIEKMRFLNAHLPVLVFLSMSKSVSRGITLAGCLICNETHVARDLLDSVRTTSAAFDTNSKPDQMWALCKNHRGVEERCITAYKVAVHVGERLVAAVKDVCKYDMGLAFVSPENAAKGFTTSTFSFNLPPPTEGTPEINAALAQKFTDILTKHAEFKPCVSFGQDNGLVYATVPATSTQGAIKEEDKAKQAVGGVQLVRLSFAPTTDKEKVSTLIINAITELYSVAA